jgi:chemotaxis protein CheD
VPPTDSTVAIAADSRFHAGAIGMGEIGVARGDGQLKTFVGSCVGLALYDRKQRVAGLAHIMLPDSKGQGTPPGKYADTAIPETLRLLRALTADIALRPAAKIVGGAKMFAFQTGMNIGEQNVAAVERLLADLDIPIIGRLCGGDQGRRITLDVASGQITVESIGSPSQQV